MKDPLLIDEDPGLPPVIHLPKPSPKTQGMESQAARPERERERGQWRSHFVFGPGFTQVLLLVCILMLGIVIGMKVSDYFHERHMERAELALYRAGQGTRPPETAPATPATPPAPQPPIPVAAVPPVPTAEIARLTPPTEAAPSGKTNPDYSEELALLQQERDLMRQRFDTLKQPAASVAPEPKGSPVPSGATSGLPEPRPAASQPVSGPAAPAKQEISAAEQRIRDAPALGKVLEYDADWHFVVINCGSQHNLEAGRKLAIRRGGTLLGLIHLDEILPQQSVAELEGAWKTDPKALKPQPGDDVLTFPPF